MLPVDIRVQYNSTYITYHILAENNMAALKRSTRIDRSCCGGIFT